MDYDFRKIEEYWRTFWKENQTFRVEEDASKEKFYVLDMFPYPSGAGLHVGHPLGYIASDIYARYKRLKGFNVLHPMGYDSFGLPAEQYAIQTGQHPAITTKTNIDGGVDNAGNKIAGYRKQLDILGFSFDWSREVRTSSPDYYKWTQWIFKQIFDSYYNYSSNKAEPISELISIFQKEGNGNVNACTEFATIFTSTDWNAYSEKEKEDILQEYRLAYLADSWVNWCPALGTVLANDEVVNGVSERGGHPVEQKLMRQWSMRIKAYADRLLTGLDGLDWTDSIKDQQRNWIGKSVGCSLQFDVDNSDKKIEVFTTRPDTVFGVSFMVLAPEHPLVDQITTAEFKHAIANYKKEASLKSERDRQSDVKNISGQNTGAFAIHPFTGEKIQIWIGDYVLASYGTGAVMAVPCGDQRDYDFAKHFNIEIINIFQDVDLSEAAYTEKDAVIANSDFLNGLNVKDATKKVVAEIEKKGIGKGKIQYRLRDAIFSRQRYWGEPFPVYYQDGLPKTIHERDLPIVLPEVEKYLPTEDGQPPLGNSHTWAWDVVDSQIVNNINIDNKTVFPIELNTMPGWAGSSWYFLRYMDPKNETEFVAKEKVDYWKNVDLYIGGSEHATGHLLYSRFWTKFLFDRGFIPFEEPFQKMINQGMILGNSAYIHLATVRFTNSNDGNISLDVPRPKVIFITYDAIHEHEAIISEWVKHNYPRFEGKTTIILTVRPIPVGLVQGSNEINTEELKLNTLFNDIDFEDALFLYNENNKFILQREVEKISTSNSKFILQREVEKMSKSKYNVQTPDELVEKFGADTLRMYEMFLGPIEQAKPWDTKGITGVHNFLRKFLRLFKIDENGDAQVSTDTPSKEALKTLHKTIKKVTDDLERYSFNTGVSNFMICVNELTEQKCNNKAILQELVVLLSSYAPHISEELWFKLGNDAGTLSDATFPEFNEAFMQEDAYSYPVSFNGKMRFKLELDANLGVKEIEEAVMKSEQTIKYLEGKTPKKVIIVPKKIVNIVI